MDSCIIIWSKDRASISVQQLIIVVVYIVELQKHSAI
jgi:hypothetical protein